MRPDPRRVARRFLEAGRYHTLGTNYLNQFIEGGEPNGTELIRAMDAMADAIRKRNWDAEYPYMNDAQREQMKQHYGLAATHLLGAANDLRRNIKNVRKRVKRREDRTAATIKVRETPTHMIVTGPYALMKKVYPKLKGRGFSYNPDDQSWRIPLSQLTPRKRTNLDKLLKPYLAGVETEAERKQKELARRIRDRLLIKVPFDYRHLPKEEGGIWYPKNQTWAMPDRASIERVRERLTAEGYVLKSERDRRVREGLTVSVPYDHRTIPREEGGVWIKDIQMWAMPDRQAVERVHKRLLPLLQEERRKRQERETERREERQRELAKYVMVTEYSRRRGGHHAVGDTFRDPRSKQVVTVVKVDSHYIPEDGMSLGLGHLGWDSGWVHTLYTEPASAAETGEIEEREAEHLTKSQAVKRERELAREVSKAKNYARSNRPVRLKGDHLLYRNRRHMITGGGSWWVIEPGRAIWHVQNNGADGDDWAHNNVQTGGAGAIGYRVRYDDELADEIRRLDQLVGER